MNMHAEPLAEPNQAREQLRNLGYARITSRALFEVTGADRQELAGLAPLWSALPPDRYLRDGGHYRRRRHGCFVHDLAQDTLVANEPRAHWQPTDYNALHGGIERWFEPLDESMARSDAWRDLLIGLGKLFASVRRSSRWYIEAHPFRIDTSEGVGRPTPEGAHRDGVDFVAVLLVGRDQIRGGETRVFEGNGPRGVRFVMDEPWSALLLDDARVIHETTPIQPDGENGHRDTLVLTFRERGFQAPP